MIQRSSSWVNKRKDAQLNKQTKENLTEAVLLGTGLLSKFALLKSMTESKTLTVMVIVGLLSFSGFILFLVKMSGG
jgi:hypothetical protein